ncbi:MAG TPA: hypothetical protein VHZ51_10910, partial [Ktedonobacteraceae bacterium]|nr:hypothetical protein [Ktedonobacteraceae bacterium]
MVTNRCMRCQQPCSDAAMLCDACTQLLKSQRASGSNPLQDEHVDSSFAAQKTLPNGEYAQSQATVETPASVGDNHVDMAAQVLRKLNVAAQRIEEVAQKPLRKPKNARLSPYRDMSSEIQRDSTPMPQVANGQNDTVPLWVLPDSEDDDDEEETQQDAWQNRTDPLATRRLPDSNDGQRIERADIERAAADGYIALPWPGKQVRMRASRLRLFIICMVALAVVGFVVDGLLVSLSLQHPSHAASTASSSNHLPTLMLSNNKVSNGQSVVVHISHFTPSGFVFLSHDIGEQVRTDAGSSKIQVDKNGSRNVTLLIDSSWAAGAHMLEAEDMLTRYSASASLLLISGQTYPSQFGLDDTRMNLGADQQGANTLRTLTLRNSTGGNGAISWSAS